MAAWQVNVEVDDPPAVNVTPVIALQVSPVDGFAVNDTAPVKPFTEVTVMVDEPELVARLVASMLVGETAPRATVKVGAAPTVTETSVVLESVVGEVPVVPVIVNMKLDGLGTAVQLTLNVVPDTVAVHDDVGDALVENATLPVKPLIAVNDSAEV